jgi:hypothetical protein
VKLLAISVLSAPAAAVVDAELATVELTGVVPIVLIA